MGQETAVSEKTRAADVAAAQVAWHVGPALAGRLLGLTAHEVRTAVTRAGDAGSGRGPQTCCLQRGSCWPAGRRSTRSPAGPRPVATGSPGVTHAGGRERGGGEVEKFGVARGGTGL